MPRWDTNAEGRLLTAAMELFLERGYDQVTVAEIAERAGLKKRSYFRYFADKREVLFGGAPAFEEAVLAGVRSAPPERPPLDAVAAALTAAGVQLTAWGDAARLRQQVIDANRELRERELIKFASLAAAASEILQGRGVDEVTAGLAAQAGVTVFATAFRRWVASPAAAPFDRLMTDSLARLREAVRG